MKKVLVFCAAALCLSALPGASKQQDAILRMLNSRSSGSVATYEQAAAEVAKMAAKGKPGSPRRAVARLLVAVASREPDAPSVIRLDAQTRDLYLASTNEIHRLAIEKDNGLAWYLLAVESGSTNQILKAVSRKNPQALNAWGTYLIDIAMNPRCKEDERKRILAEAQDCFKTAAGMGDINGMYNLGMSLSRGFAGEADQEGAFNCFRSAAEEGHPEAINNVGFFFKEGVVVERDLETAERWYKRSADMRNPYGMFNYAMLIRSRDAAAAAAILKESADLGSVEAMDMYGEMLAAGEGVAKNPTAAFLMYRRAASEGYPRSMDHLAECYERGIGTKPDQRKSTLWMIRARAARGDVNAEAWLNENNE